MAHGRNPGYVPGDHWNTCMRCGFDMRASESVVDGDSEGLIVCRACYDPKHPQDRVRSRGENTAPQGLTTGKIDNE